MSQRSPFQRFLRELRRRHVPQTAAVYVVAAWAAIEFADVVVPNLDGPPWIVTTVIVAALLGLPAVLVLAWFFDWGPEGLIRTGPADGEEELPETRSPWIPALAVLVVGIGSALAAVAVLIPGDGAPAGTERQAVAPAATGAGEGGGAEEQPPGPGARPGDQPRHPVIVGPQRPPTPGEEIELGIAQAMRALSGLDTLRALAELGNLGAAEVQEAARAALVEAGISVVVSEPSGWRPGLEVPEPLAEGDTLAVSGVAQDPEGVAAVYVDGREVARAAEPRPALRFETELVGTGSVGERAVTVLVETADGREIRKRYTIIQAPASAG